MSGWLRVWCVLGVLLVGPTRVSAEPDLRPETRPWAAGVAAADQTRALETFTRGNELLAQDSYAPALELYRQAIAIWDHPAIRYNMAVADIKLERPIDAYQELERALRYPDALEPGVHEQALVYERLLHAQIVQLSIDCVDPGTRITLDKDELVVPCPGSSARLILPGRHHLIAAKPGYLTRTIELAPSGGETPHERLELKTIEQATVIRRRWKPWKPWTVVGAGVAVGLVGLGIELQSAATFRSYDHAVAVLCPDHPCSTLPGVITDAYGQAHRENQVASGFFIASGATIVTGAVLMWLNRAVSERLGYDNLPIPTASFRSGESTLGITMPF